MLGSVFVKCRLRPAAFDEVDFTLAMLGGNDLRGVDFSGCRMRETNLAEADLRKAVLRGADLGGARTIGVRLDEADLICVPQRSIRRCGRQRPWRVPRIDVGQALAYAIAHGLDVHGD
jgi:Pentapeptide repeats (8 copies)